MAPFACALARTAAAALAVSHDGDMAAVRQWLTIQARTVREHAATLDVDHPADQVVIAVAEVFAEDLCEDERADTAAATAEREQRGRELVVEWARPGHSAEDHVEVLMAGGRFAAVMVAYALAFDEARIITYLENHSRELIASGR